MAVSMAVSPKGSLMSADNRRGYREGSIYQRCDEKKGCPPLVLVEGRKERPKHKCTGPWIGSFDAGWTERGTRRRPTVQAATEALVKKKLRDKMREYDRTGEVTSDRITVKQWGDEYLALRVTEVRPNSYAAIRTAVRKWIVPTVGRKRVADLTPADIRAIDTAMYAAGCKTGHVHDIRGKLVTMLRRAEAEGHRVSPRLYTVKRPGQVSSDRMPLTVEATVKCLLQASELEHGIRWVLALVYGARLEETLGLTEDALDFEAKIIRLDWQLQRVPYLDSKNHALGFRVPQDYEMTQLHRSYHLVRPKTQSSRRDLPMHPVIEDALRAWLPQRPESKCLNGARLVFPNARGLPKNDEEDRQEWWDLQEAAGVRHPKGERYYHIHECRNFAATQAGETDASDAAVTSLFGHASIKTTRGYQAARDEGRQSLVHTLVSDLQAAGWSDDGE